MCGSIVDMMEVREGEGREGSGRGGGRSEDLAVLCRDCFPEMSRIELSRDCCLKRRKDESLRSPRGVSNELTLIDQPPSTFNPVSRSVYLPET